MINLDQLASRTLARLEDRGVELDVEAFERAAHPRGTRADNDDVVSLFSQSRVSAHRDLELLRNLLRGRERPDSSEMRPSLLGHYSMPAIRRSLTRLGNSRIVWNEPMRAGTTEFL